MSNPKRAEALEFARSVPNVCLATVEGEVPHARAMEVAQVDDDFSFWFTTSANSNKITQIEKNPNACVMLWQGITDLKITGKAQLITDRPTKDALYKDKWDIYYRNGGKDDPDYAVIKITPEKAEYRDMQKYGLVPENVL